MVVRTAFPGYFEIFFQAQSSTFFALLLGGILVLPRSVVSSAVSQVYLVLYLIGLGP